MVETALKVYKANGTPQRSNLMLSKEIAGSLVQKIFSGETIFPKEGRLEIDYIGKEGEEIVIELSCNTIHNWIKRGNVIPETGETLRDLLDRAREDKRTKEREARQKSLVDQAEAKMSRTMNLRTTVPIRNMFGQLVKNEDGSIARRENHNVLRVQMDVAKYVTERLDPDRYSRVDKSENKHLHFSLADLRKAKQEQTETEVQS